MRQRGEKLGKQFSLDTFDNILMFKQSEFYFIPPMSDNPVGPRSSCPHACALGHSFPHCHKRKRESKNVVNSGNYLLPAMPKGSANNHLGPILPSNPPYICIDCFSCAFSLSGIVSSIAMEQPANNRMLEFQRHQGPIWAGGEIIN